MGYTPATPEATPEVPVTPETPVPPQPEVKKHRYQPTDEFNRPIGGEQVILYTTEAELIQKLTNNHVESIKGMRNAKRQARLSTPETDALPADADQSMPFVQFKEKPLTTEERYGISQDLNDPTKFESARDRLFESAVGVQPAQLRETLNTQQQMTLQIMARQNSQVWLERHPEFYACNENINTVCEWMRKVGLDPSVRNFELAQAKMEEAGLLLSSPIVREVLPETPQPQVVAPVVEILPEPQAVAVEPVRINETPLPQEKRQTSSPVPSGLNNRIAPVGGALPVAELAQLTLKQIDDMPSDKYREQIMTNPAFAKRVNELEAARPPRPRR